MFTGIIEELGTVTSIIRAPQAGRIVVAAGKVAAEAKIGDSVAVNGVCLTVTTVRRQFLEFDLSAESLKRANFSDLRVGEKVNLEQAVKVGERLGGHLVTGHVDAAAEIKRITKVGAGFEFFFSIPGDLFRFMVPKGSVTLDGISLTVADLRDDLLMVAVVPLTIKNTNLRFKAVGDKVNLEVDLLSKYIERHLRSDASLNAPVDPMFQLGYLPMGWIDN